MPDGGKIWIETKNETVEGSLNLGEERLKPGEYLTVSIKDTGVGMDEKTLSRIFEPFFSTKGKDKGVGLGLPVAWGIVKQHNGNIEVHSSPGKGSTFKLYFPVYEVHEKEEIKLTNNEGGKKETGSGETILIAEDEENIRELLSEVLEDLGYKVILARDGLEAIELFGIHRDIINLLILDIVMPKVSGYDVYRNIVSMNINIPTVFITGYTEEKLESKIKSNSTIDIVTKPFTPETIARKIRELLDRVKE